MADIKPKREVRWIGKHLDKETIRKLRKMYYYHVVPVSYAVAVYPKRTYVYSELGKIKKLIEEMGI